MDEDDISIWRGVGNPMATDFLRLAIEDREEFYASDDPAERTWLARRVLMHLLRAAEAMAGDEISSLAFGDNPAEGAAHSEHMEALAARLRLVGAPFQFRGGPAYPYSVRAVAEEVEYMAWGDPPKILRAAQRGGNKSAKRREVEHWARALEWIEFLSLATKRRADCKVAVAEAYSVTTDRFTSWRKRVREELGDRVIRRIERAGERPPIDFRFETEEDGLAALKSDGQAYNDFLSAKNQTSVVRLVEK